MRLPTLMLFTASLATACGGNVVVDHGSAGAGASGGSGLGAGSATGSGGGTGTGGVIVTGSIGSSTATGAGAGLPTCASLGYVGVNDSCGQEGQECTMPGTCCNAPIICQNGRWAMTGLTCDQACDTCGGVLGCSPNVVCIEDQIHDVETAFRCAADPCPGDGPPDCACAGALCTDVFLMCVGGSAPTMLVCTDGSE